MHHRPPPDKPGQVFADKRGPFGHMNENQGEHVLTENRKVIAGKIWEIANRLRGPYRPPQYRLVM